MQIISTKKNKSQQQKLSIDNQKKGKKKIKVILASLSKFILFFSLNSWESYLCFRDINTIPGLPFFLILHCLSPAIL